MTLLRWVDIESEEFQINVIENGKFCKVKAKGDINYRATLFALVRLISDFSFDSGYKIIIDFEDANIDFTNEEITGLLNYIKHIQEFYTNRFALLLPKMDSSLSSLIISRFTKAGIRMDFIQGSKNIDIWLKNTPSF